MTLTVEIKINGRLIAGAIVHNTSNLADLSDYEVEVVEKGDPTLGIQDMRAVEPIEGHPRRQTCWALVRKVAVFAERRAREHGEPSDVVPG